MTQASKIYTKTGDRGETSLFGGTRVSKASDRVETYGSIDELNSLLGVVVAHLNASDGMLKHSLEQIQRDLFSIGSYLATPDAEPVASLPARITSFEQMIDEMTEQLPGLHNFILPGGGKAGSFLHMARTVCRRTERRLVHLAKTEQIDKTLIKYINRLSDLLFTMARFANHNEKKQETVWKLG